MHNLIDVLERLERYLDAYKLGYNANDARKIGEAVCRVILLNSENELTRNKSSETKFQSLIESISRKNLTENENHLKKIKSDLIKIQTFGNIESHDGEVHLDENELKDLRESVKNLFRNVFDSKEYIDIDEKIPVSIYDFFGKSVAIYEDWRCDKIISIVYPNRSINKVEEHRDFQFYTFEDVNEKKVGFVMLGRNISFSSSLHQFFSKNSDFINNLVSLTFLFPKEISKTTGKEVKNRKANIVNKCLSYKSYYQRVDFTYEFIEDYIWKHCLPNNLKESSNVTTEPFFIDQLLYNDVDEKLSLKFLEEIIVNKSKDQKPIHILLGDGGVGKTTFCTQAIERLDHLLSEGSKKKALLLSSFDLPEELNSSEESIDSIQSLYRIIQDDPDTRIDSQSLALNISSGNLIIFIDGLDEIESKLKEKFNLEAFIESVIDLNDTYLNCAVIITSRDNNSDKFDKNKVNIYQLKGFDDSLIEKYLETRYRPGSEHSDQGYERKVLDYVSDLSLESNRTVTPLIIRLICELVESQGATGEIKKSSDSKYFDENHALDKVVFQIINRDIIKQGINISCDDYFEILKDVVFEYNCIISKSELDELLEYSLIDMSEESIRDYTSFYVSPLLKRVGDDFRIKHDSLEFWIKARYVSHQINTRSIETNEKVLKMISRDCYRGGSLVKEVTSKNLSGKIDYFTNTIKNIVGELNDSKINIQVARKVISSMLYLAMPHEVHTKDKYSEMLLSLFGVNNGERIRYLSIYGEFYPLNFSEFIVVDGYFSGYTNLGKSSFPGKKVVFIDCEFKDIEAKFFSRHAVTHENFDNCILSNDIKQLIEGGAKTKQDQLKNIKSDLKKIFKVGFRQSSFVWKSEKLYKQQCASLKHKLILSEYLERLIKEGYINSESAKGSAGSGYKICLEKEHEVKDFITQGIIGNELHELIENLRN